MYIQPYFPQFSPIMQKSKEKKQKPKKLYAPTPLDTELLKYVREYHFLTAWQLVKIHYSDGSLTRAQTKLKNLYDTEYLDRRALPDVRVGQPTWIYALSTKGINYLKELGYSSFSRYRPNELQHMKYPHLEHVLSLNDVLIAARNLPKQAPDISLDEMRHDLDMKKTPAKVEFVRRLPTGDKADESVKLVPDAWLYFSLTLANTEKKRRKGIIIELDRGSETNIAEFKKKIRAYVHFAIENGAYYQMFGTNSITVAYATTAGENRLRTMQLWCEQELQEQRLDYDAALFRFTALPQGTIDPCRLFLADVWYVPFEKKPVTLLWKP